MHGGAVELARRFLAEATHSDLLLATDMLYLPTFLALIRHQSPSLPVAIYFHENQLTYPWSPHDVDPALQRHHQYAFMNYTSMLVADRVFFNSAYHRDALLGALPDFLRQFPDYQGLDTLAGLSAKSEVLPLGMDLRALDKELHLPRQGSPVLLWNHRWEYDKDPEAFFALAFRLKAAGLDFRLLVLGEHYQRQPAIFAQAKVDLADHIIHIGYVDDRSTYLRYLWQADILPVTSRQDFFGGSIVEAMYCGVYPLLPNRLAYPEHLPDSQKSRYLYEGQEALYQKVREAMANIDEVRRRADEVRAMVAHYDWSIMHQQYDKAFTAITAS